MKQPGVIKIQGKADIPDVLIDENQLLVRISGSSFNENAIDMYYKIIDWIHKVEKNLSKELKFEFDYVYLNSSSKKMIFVILNQLENLHKAGKKVSVSWFYEEYDEDMLELGEDFAELITMPFKYIPKEVEDEEEEAF
jgi:hypothetical protein